MKYIWCDKMELKNIVFVFLLCLIASSYSTAQDFICGFPGAPAYGSVSENHASYKAGAIVHFACDVGHILLGSPISRCRDDGTWSEEVPICDDSMTTLISAISSAAVPGYPTELAIDKNRQTCTYLHPKPIRYWRIDLGGDRLYRVLTVALTMKNLEKNMKFTVFVISEESGVLANAHYRRCASFSGKFGTPTIILSCAEGKGVEGTKVHIEDHYPMDGLFELCEVEVQVQKDTGYDCGLPSRNLHSIVKKSSVNLAEYDCLRGYRINGNAYRRCMKTGQWSGTPPICEPIICEDLEPLENGNISYRHGNSGPILEGAIAHYICNYGYKLFGLPSRLCLEDGSWEGKAPKCKAIKCPLPDGEEVGGVYRLLNRTSNMGTMALLRCKEGKIQGDNPYLTCTESGEWTRPEAVCVIPARASAEKPKPPKIVNQGGIIFGMVVAAIMIVVVLVGLYLYGEKRRNIKPEIPSRLIEPPTPPPRPPPRVKGNSFKSAFKGFLNRENTDSDKQALKDSWKTQSLPLDQGEPNEAGPRKALSYGETFPGDENSTVVEVSPDYSRVKRAHPSVPEEPENAAAEDVTLEIEGEESTNDSSAKSPGPDYAAVDYEKKRQSRVLKEQESMESSTSAAASPLPDDESEGKLTSRSPTPPKKTSGSEEEEEEEEEEEKSEESEASTKLNVTDSEESKKEELRRKEEEERKAKEEEEKKKKEEEEKRKEEEEKKKKEEEEKKKESEAPGSRRRRLRDEPPPPADDDKPVLRRLRRFQ